MLALDEWQVEVRIVWHVAVHGHGVAPVRFAFECSARVECHREPVACVIRCSAHSGLDPALAHEPPHFCAGFEAAATEHDGIALDCLGPSRPVELNARNSSVTDDEPAAVRPVPDRSAESPEFGELGVHEAGPFSGGLERQSAPEDEPPVLLERLPRVDRIEPDIV